MTGKEEVKHLYWRDFPYNILKFLSIPLKPKHYRRSGRRSWSLGWELTNPLCWTVDRLFEALKMNGHRMRRTDTKRMVKGEEKQPGRVTQTHYDSHNFKTVYLDGIGLQNMAEL